MQINANLRIDYGNSESRFNVSFMYNSKEYSIDFDGSNRFARVDANYKVPKDYKTQSSCLLQVQDSTLLDSVTETEPYAYANGVLCEREFKNSSFRPSALTKKYLSKSTKLTTSYAIYRAYEIIERTIGTGEPINVSWRIAGMLPPIDTQEEGIREMTKLINSVKKIEVLFPKKTIDVDIISVDIYSECFCAYMGTLFVKTRDGIKIREGYEEWLQAKVFLSDIGAGTTDSMILEGTETVERSKDSYNIGGNQIIQKIKKALRQDYDLSVSDKEVESALSDGIVYDSGEPLDITDMVVKAKREVADAEVSYYLDYFDNIQYPLRSIKGLFICGGGTLAGDKPELPPLSQVIEKYIKEQAPKLKLIPLPYELDFDGRVIIGANGAPKTVNPRMLNLRGLCILDEM